MKGVWIEAPAKVNLTLEVGEQRSDGFHEIRSILVPVSLCDRLEMRPAAADSLAVAAEGVSLAAIGRNEDNLVLRAVELLRQASGRGGGVALRLVKRIPVGGGLGGGSADCAATLVGLNRLWGLGWSRERLMELGAGLGSDVPALVHGGAVVMEGRGEHVTPIPVPQRWEERRFCLLLANPGVAVSTAAAYRHYVRESTTGLTSASNFYTIVYSALQRGDARAAAAGLFNDLESSVFPYYRAVEALVQQLRATDAWGVLMSGSGATVFALLGDMSQAEAVSAALSGAIWRRIVWTLPDGVMAAHGILDP